MIAASQQCRHLFPASLAFAWSVANSGDRRHLLEGRSALFNGLDQANQFHPLADTAGLEPGHGALIRLHADHLGAVVHKFAGRVPGQFREWRPKW